MGAVLTTFGIDWRLLLINSVNFGLLMLVLWYFVYGPLTNMLEERRKRVAQGVKDAEAAGIKLKEIESSRGDILAQAGREADEVLKKSRELALERERDIRARADAAAAQSLKEAQSLAQEAKAQALLESKQEVAKLVVLGIEKALKQ